MNKAFVLLTTVFLCLFVAGFMMLKTLVLDDMTFSQGKSLNGQIVNEQTFPDNSLNKPVPEGSSSSNPHGLKDYKSLTAEQRQQANAALNNAENALSQFLKSEVEVGLMTQEFANELNSQLQRLLTINRSNLSDDQATNRTQL